MASLAEKCSVREKVIVITGGIGYLGSQYCEGLAKEGAFVIAWNNGDESVLKEKSQLLGCVDCNLVDVTDHNACKEAAQMVVSRFGKIDVLINNAAMNPAVEEASSADMFAPYEEYRPDLWKRELSVMLDGSQFATQAVAPHMMNARRGAVINIGSELSLGACDNRFYGEPPKYKSMAYVVGKHAIIGLTRQWAEYLGPFGVRINCFCPGGVQNPKVPEEFAERYGKQNMLHRMAQPGEYLPTLLYLCSDVAPHMTGSVLVHDGGRSVFM